MSGDCPLAAVFICFLRRTSFVQLTVMSRTVSLLCCVMEFPSRTSRKPCVPSQCWPAGRNCLDSGGFSRPERRWELPRCKPAVPVGSGPPLRWPGLLWHQQGWGGLGGTNPWVLAQTAFRKVWMQRDEQQSPSTPWELIPGRNPSWVQGRQEWLQAAGAVLCAVSVFATGRVPRPASCPQCAPTPTLRRTCQNPGHFNMTNSFPKKPQRFASGQQARARVGKSLICSRIAIQVTGLLAFALPLPDFPGLFELTYSVLDEGSPRNGFCCSWWLSS